MRIDPIPLDGIFGFSAVDSDGAEAKVISDGSSYYCFLCRSDSCAHASAVAARVQDRDSERIMDAISNLDPGSESLSDDVDSICEEIFCGSGGHDRKLRQYSRLMDECVRLESEGAIIWPDQSWEERASIELRSSSADAVWQAISSEGGVWARDLVGELDPKVLRELVESHPLDPALMDAYLALGEYEDYIRSNGSSPEAVLEAMRRIVPAGQTSECLRLAGMLPDIREMDAKGRNAAHEIFEMLGDAESMRRIETENLLREPSEYALKVAMSSGKSRDELIRMVAEKRLGEGADDGALSFLARNGMSQEVLSCMEFRSFSFPESFDIARVVRAMSGSGQSACAKKTATEALECILKEGRDDSFRQAVSLLSYVEQAYKSEAGGAKEFRSYMQRLLQDYGDRKGFWDILG
ncbi:MAG: hypothetical protein IKP20_08505 [Candidatus Methanomethylophilaceae archaeon]|nr:hypothetical protein [Candidatus Methanomethylophilaceae archaeon]